MAVQKADEAGEKVDIAAFQSLSTRKRKNVTESNASVPAGCPKAADRVGALLSR